MPPLVLDGTNGVSGVDGTASNPAIEGTDSNTGIFYPAADTVAIGTGGTERVRVSSAGVVGVNTTSPAAIGANYGTIDIRGSSGGGFNLGTTGTLTGQIYGNSSGITYDAQGALTHFWYTNSLERMTLDASGNLLVNTTTAGGKLTVSGTATFGTGTWPTGSIGLSDSRAGVLSSNENGIFGVFNTSGTVAANNGGEIRFGATATTSTANATQCVVGGYKDNATSGNFAGYLAFKTSDAAGTITERARITSAGGFTCAGIYNTTVGATNRDVFVDNGGVVGYVSSVRASKTNIQDLTDTSWLHQLNPVTFNYRKKDEEGNYTDETDGDIQYGMIAEDVEQVRPDLCFYDEVDGEQELRGIQYSKLVPVMLKAIQEQQAMIDELKAKVAALENA